MCLMDVSWIYPWCQTVLAVKTIVLSSLKMGPKICVKATFGFVVFVVVTVWLYILVKMFILSVLLFL